MSNLDTRIIENMLSDTINHLRLDKYTKEETPKLVILGGQPASGKTSVINDIKNQYRGNIVVLNSDDYKELYPNYSDLMKSNPNKITEIQPYSNYVLGEVMKEVAPKGLNTLVEGTMRNSDYPLQVINGFKSCGYKSELVIVASNYFSSRAGCIERYEAEMSQRGFGRFVPPAHHDDAYKNIPSTIQTLLESKKLDNITICNRAGEIIAQSAKGDDVVKAYTSFRDNITLDQYKDITDRIDKTMFRMFERGASVSSEFNELKDIKKALTQEFNKQHDIGSKSLDKSQSKGFER